MIASTQRIVRWACLILATSLPLLLIPAQAQAAPLTTPAPVTITVDGKNYDINVVEGEWNVIKTTAALKSQFWWGNGSLALDFATAFGANASSPLTGYSYFAWGENVGTTFIDAAYSNKSITPAVGQGGAYASQGVRYATATLSASSVPEINAGSLSQALLILFALWLVTRRRVGAGVA